MKRLYLLLLIVFFLSSCAPAVTATSTPTDTTTPAPTATQTPNPTPTLTPAPTPVGGWSGKYLFELNNADFTKYFPDLKGDVNFFISNTDGTELKPITDGLKGIYLIDGISPDRSKILVTSLPSYNATNGSFYIIDINAAGNRISEKLAAGGSAQWVDNVHFIYTGDGEKGRGIYIINADGTEAKKIGNNTANATIIAVDSTRAYLHSYVKKVFRDDTGFLYKSGDFNALWWANLDGSGEGKLESNGKQILTDGGTWQTRFAFSPDGKSIAWIPSEYESNCDLGDRFVAPWIKDGVYTKYAGQTSPGVFNKNRSDFGKTVDMAFIKDYIGRCFIMYVAPLSQMDDPLRVVLLPSDNFFNLSFVFSRDYSIEWYPDGSKILLLYSGDVLDNKYPYPPVLFYASLDDPTKISLLYNNFPDNLAGTIFNSSFSPDGKRITITGVGNQLPTKVLDLQNIILSDAPDFTYKSAINVLWLP